MFKYVPMSDASSPRAWQLMLQGMSRKDAEEVASAERKEALLRAAKETVAGQEATILPPAAPGMFKSVLMSDASSPRAAQLMAEENGEKTAHEVGTSRSHPLDAVIAMAKKSAVDSADYHSVWATLVKLAESNSRPAPLLGYVEGEGIKYQGNAEVKFFTKDALRKREGRESKKGR